MQALLRWRKLAALIVGLLLMSTLYVQPPVSAAGGISFVYIVDGQEITVPYDPISLKDGLLLPQGLLQELGVAVSVSGSSITLNRGGLIVQLNTRSQVAVVNGKHVNVGQKPIQMGGHLFVPAAVLQPLGIQMTAEGNLLLIDRWPLAQPSTQSTDYATIVSAVSVPTHMEVGKGVSLTATVVHLSPEIVQDAAWTDNPAVRGQALALFEDHTLLEIQLHNQTTGFQSFQPSTLRLVDDLNRQYAPTGEILPLDDAGGQLAPEAKSRAVIAFPAIQDGATTIKLYSPANTSSVATFTLP